LPAHQTAPATSTCLHAPPTPIAPPYREARRHQAATCPNNGVILLPQAIIEANRFMIIEMAARHQLPAIYPLRHYAAAGGLIAYGLEPRNVYRQVAVYVDRVLRGARPAELPVQQPTRFELAINLRTAKALGLDLPPSLLAIADEVIE